MTRSGLAEWFTAAEYADANDVTTEAARRKLQRYYGHREVEKRAVMRDCQGKRKNPLRMLVTEYRFLGDTEADS